MKEEDQFDNIEIICEHLNRVSISIADIGRFPEEQDYHMEIEGCGKCRETNIKRQATGTV